MSSRREDDIPDIDCAEFVELVEELVDTEPSLWGPVVDKHFSDCPPCEIYLQQMLDIRAIFARVREGQQLSDDEVGRVLAAIATY